MNSGQYEQVERFPLSLTLANVALLEWLSPKKRVKVTTRDANLGGRRLVCTVRQGSSFLVKIDLDYSVVLHLT